MFTRDDSSGNPDTRSRVLAATRKLMDERGVARVRVDAVAKEAGLSAGALYRHFKGREELILAVILESVPRDMPMTAALPSEDGAQEDSLSTLIDQIYEHEKRMAAVAVTVLADEQLSSGFRDMLSRAPGGPEDFTRALAAALRSYVEAGVLRRDLDVGVAATFVQGRCFHHAVLDRLHGPREALGAPPAVTAEIVNFLKA
ncbi:helix-turn-helix domain-containing protein [Pseudonocardia sp. NPDC049635]|uniref:TetR/AcrR family transcriptional regulator n=1 Tax=Pseudonocardia sp. NPDC049635 TaxID=3155506 RepID=UPI0033E8D75E